MTQTAFAARRKAFLDKMGRGLAIFPTAPSSTRSNDVEYPYRPDSDFYYLTGFGEPEAVCLLSPDAPEERFVLFVRPRDPAQEAWSGSRHGTEGAKERFSADATYPIENFETLLPQYLADHELLFYPTGKYPPFDQKILRGIEQARSASRGRSPRKGPPTQIIDAREFLHEMRLVKDPCEVELLRQACRITAEGHLQAMRTARSGLFEYEVAAEVEYTFRRRGASGPSFPTIVGSGPNATVLHYTENRRRIEPGDLVLVDAGAEFALYAGDVTRTFSADRRLSAPQRDLYQIVFEAQQKAIETISPGRSFAEVHQKALEVLVEGLVSLGILRGAPATLLESGAYRPFYWHNTSHWLGLDVHDVGKYRQGGVWRRLDPGMVLTVEPGLYVPPETEAIDARYRGLGIRIEDDVLVTATGYEVLTAGAPKRLNDVEALRST